MGLSTDQGNATKALEFERILTRALTDLAGHRTEEIDPIVEQAFADIGSYLGLEFFFVIRLSESERNLVVTHAWREDREPPEARVFPCSEHRWATEFVRSGHRTLWSDDEDFPKGFDDATAALIRRTGIRCLGSVPINNRFRSNAIAVFGCFSRNDAISESTLMHIDLFSSALAGVLDRKHVERVLKLTRHSVDIIEGAVFWSREDASIAYVNETALRMLGYDREELMNLTIPEVDPEIDLDRYRATFRELRSRGRLRFRTPKRHKDGHLIPVEVEAVHVDIDGEELAVSFARDLSEQRAVEKTLRESELRFRALFEAAPLAIAVVDRYQQLIRTNQSFRDLFQLEGQPSDIVNAVQHFTHPDDLEGSQRELQELLTGSEQSIQMKKRYVRADGSEFWAVTTASAIRDLDGQLEYIVVMILDVTPQKQAEDALEEALSEITALKDRIEAENFLLRDQLRSSRVRDRIIAKSKTMQTLLQQAERVAATDATVLIQGETGTGKELLAHAIHEMSPRRSGPWVAVNCGAIPGSLIENELFGSERGAFTGAHARHVGRFEAAHGGTIFLDEIAELPTELQAKLLRALEDRRIERLGGTRSIPVDVRVIAATNVDLERAVKEGRFRKDLFYRLNVYPLTIPPLRQRRTDIEALATAFARECGERIGKTIEGIDPESLDPFDDYPWPGNVRELRNLVERAVIESSSPRIHLPMDESVRTESDPMDLTLEAVERRHILAILDRTGWRVRGRRGAAEVLGLKPSTLESRMKKLGIRRPHRSG